VCRDSARSAEAKESFEDLKGEAREEKCFHAQRYSCKRLQRVKRNSLESSESQTLKRDSVFEYAGETKGCRDCRGKAKVEAFGIWKILQSS
jgi:hypothetical protein